MTDHSTDVVIIGAGPVGLFAVAQLGMQARLKCHLIDSLDKPGGQPAELYPDKPIYDIPAVPVINGQDLTDALMEQGRPFEPVLHLGQKAEELEKLDDGQWRVTTDIGERITAPVLLISTGRGLFDPRKPKIENIGEFENTSVFYAVRKGVRELLHDKDVVIAGGGDSALDWCLSLASEAKSLTLIHRRDGFRAADDSVEKMKEMVRDGRINFLIAEPVGLQGSNGALEAVEVKVKSGERFAVAADYFLPFFGMSPKLGKLETWGLELERGKIIVQEPKYSETSVSGIFAIGDASTYDGKQELILTGFQEAAHATAGAYRHVHGKELRVQFTTSSTDILNALGVEKHVDTVGELSFETPIQDLIASGRVTVLPAA
ncbi:MAG: NAD(P)/FAD-dependent oxidoreductase [Pseudomonadota bacterium]